MGRCARVALAVFAVFLVGSSSLAEVRIYFSPNGGCDQAIAELVKSAQVEVDAACYSFSLASIAEELRAARGRGVAVRLIADRTSAEQIWSQPLMLAILGLPVRVNEHSGLMHDKFLVVDGKSVATGSFNWTAAAVEKNDENLVVFLNEPQVAAQFATRFDQMWTDQVRFVAFAPSLPTPVTTPPPAAAPAPQVTAPATPAVADTVYITTSGTKYHRAGCRSLANSAIPISRQDAITRGYEPCSICKP